MPESNTEPQSRDPRIGVFVCHCGINIASTVDVEGVAKQIAEEPNVVTATHYTYMCSTPGQESIVDAIREHRLDRVLVAACSPRMHEPTFRSAAVKGGLNPFMCEMANIREHCSWVHEDREQATEKAQGTILGVLEKLSGDLPLDVEHVPVTKRALVVGAGIAGIQASLDIAAGGHEVVLVEREPCIGGHMAQLSETFPTLDCASCIYTPKVVEVAQNERIHLHAYSEVEAVSGNVGDFTVRIRRKARYVDEGKCTGCGLCEEKCPRRKIPSEFDRGIAERKAIYIPFPQAMPKVATIDRENCLYLQKGRCQLCKKTCDADAIDFEQEDQIVEVHVGAIIVSVGYDLFPKDAYGEYGYGKYPDVIDGLQFERMLSASGPFQGMIRRPSDHTEPKEVVFITCVGSRDPLKDTPYCCKVGCMYTAKQTMLYKHRVHDGHAYVFYMDIRAGGKRYEEFVRRAITEEGATYIRGRVSKIQQEDGKLIVSGSDTLSGTQVEVRADMVVLATAIRRQPDIEQVARTFRVSTDENGFLTEAHVKLRPVETNTAGVFLAGTCQGPKDIPETVSQAGCAAAKVLILFSSDTLTSDPVVAWVDDELCAGCGLCVEACSYEARALDERTGVAIVKEVLCQGCGACASACPSSACELKNFRTDQIMSMIDAVM